MYLKFIIFLRIESMFSTKNEGKKTLYSIVLEHITWNALQANTAFSISTIKKLGILTNTMENIVRDYNTVLNF